MWRSLWHGLFSNQMLLVWLLCNLVELGFLIILMGPSESEAPRNTCDIYVSVPCRKTHRYGRFFVDISRAYIFSKLENLWWNWFSLTLYSPWSLLILHWQSKYKRYQAICKIFCLVIGTKAILDPFLLTWVIEIWQFLFWSLTWREVLHSADWTLDILRSSSMWIQNMHEIPHSCIFLKRLLTFGLEFSPNLFFNQVALHWNTVQILVLSRTEVTFTPRKQAVYIWLHTVPAM